MPKTQQRCWRVLSLQALLALAASAVATWPAIGQEDPADAPSRAIQQPEHLVVVRLSAAALSGLLNKEIDQVTDVRDVILGTPVTGTARIIGHPRVQLEPSASQARFSMVVAGTVYSKTVGRNGPAVIHGHSITRFTATKEVVFQPGQGFHSLPPQVTAESECFTDSIQSTRGGLVGRIVERRATREIAEHKEQVRAIAQDRAARRIAAAFEHHVTEQLARLNRAVELRAELASAIDDPGEDRATTGAATGDAAPHNANGELRIVCCTTPHYVAIARGAFQPAAKRLPVLAGANEPSAPIEIWIHSSVVPKNIGAAAKTIFSDPEQSAVLQALAVLPGAFGKQAAAALTALVTQHQVAVRSIGDWLVVELNLSPAANTVAVRTLRR